MKTTARTTVTILTGLLLSSGSMFAQTTISSETSYEGTVSTFDPGTSAITVESSAGPKAYTYTKDTQFVDSEGREITYEQVRQGLPVTVYYEPVGERMIVKKVQVRRPIATRTEETTTTTTTREKH